MSSRHETYYKIEASLKGDHLSDVAKAVLDKMVRDFAIEFRVKSAVLAGNAVEMAAMREAYDHKKGTYIEENLLAAEATTEG